MVSFLVKCHLTCKFNHFTCTIDKKKNTCYKLFEKNHEKMFLTDNIEFQQEFHIFNKPIEKIDRLLILMILNIAIYLAIRLNNRFLSIHCII